MVAGMATTATATVTPTTTTTASENDAATSPDEDVAVSEVIEQVVMSTADLRSPSPVYSLPSLDYGDSADEDRQGTLGEDYNQERDKSEERIDNKEKDTTEENENPEERKNAEEKKKSKEQDKLTTDQDNDKSVIDEIMGDVVDFAVCLREEEAERDLFQDANMQLSPNEDQLDEHENRDTTNTHDRDNQTETEALATNGETQSSEVEQTDVEYVVERVLEKKLDSRGSSKFLVKWKGYPHSENTWEPLETLAECDGAIRDFELRSAELLAERLSANDENNRGKKQNINHTNKLTKRKQTASRRRPTPVTREFEVNDVMGLTEFNGERFFLISLANSTQKTFIRDSLANRIIPSKVIDFYIKSMKWKSTS